MLGKILLLIFFKKMFSVGAIWSLEMMWCGDFSRAEKLSYRLVLIGMILGDEVIHIGSAYDPISEEEEEEEVQLKLVAYMDKTLNVEFS